MPKQSGKVVLILALLILISGFVAYSLLSRFKNQGYKEQISAPNSGHVVDNRVSVSDLAKDYHSTSLNINLRVPEGARVEEKFTDIIMSFTEGEIQIRRVGTNFENINEYMNNLRKTNQPELLSEDSVKVNNYDSVLIRMKSRDDASKILQEYSIYVDSWVFKFSTSDEALYPVLDQIVQSFEYKP